MMGEHKEGGRPGAGSYVVVWCDPARLPFQTTDSTLQFHVAVGPGVAAADTRVGLAERRQYVPVGHGLHGLLWNLTSLPRHPRPSWYRAVVVDG